MQVLMVAEESRKSKAGFLSRECRSQGGAASLPSDTHGGQSPGNNWWHNESQDFYGDLGKCGKEHSPGVHLDGLLADRGGEPLDIGRGEGKWESCQVHRVHAIMVDHYLGKHKKPIVSLNWLETVVVYFYNA